MNPTTPTRNQAFWLGTIAALLALPGAAADEGCEEHAGIPLDFYLLDGADGTLALSGLAPSARNETDWKVRVRTDGVHEAEQRVRLAFPAPDHVLDESADVTGHLTVAAERIKPSGLSLGQIEIGSQQPHVDVYLLEGDRASYLGHSYPGGCWTMIPWYYPCSPQEMELNGSYPGHGPDGGPHTHGDGTDAARPLYLSDIEIEIVFRVGPVSPPVPFATPAEYEFTVTIDGNGFVRLVAMGPADAAKPVVEATVGEASAVDEDPSEEPAPAPSEEPGDSDDDPNTSSAGGTPLAGLNLLTAMAAAGAGSVALGAGAWAMLRRGRK